MSGKSRNKGSRYERKIAKIFGEVFNRDLRRVPLSGGLDIKCDIYDPFNDDFPYFIECKHRESFTLDGLINGTSDLFNFLDKVGLESFNSYLINKYTTQVAPIVVFKGGVFRTDMVMFRNIFAKLIFGFHFNIGEHLRIVAKDSTIITLEQFIKHCNKAPLVK